LLDVVHENEVTITFNKVTVSGFFSGI